MEEKEETHNTTSHDHEVEELSAVATFVGLLLLKPLSSVCLFGFFCQCCQVMLK